MEKSPDIEKCLVYADNSSEIVAFKDYDIKFKPKNIKTLAPFNPDLFLLDDPSKINDFLDSVKSKIDEEFHIFTKYENTVEKFSEDQIVKYKLLINILDKRSVAISS
jgi:hypothetical protein